MPEAEINIEEIARIGSSSRRWRRWSIWGGLFVLLMSCAWWLVQMADTPSTTKYITEPAIVSDITVIVSATGTVEPTDTVEISSELSGTVRTVDVDFNDTVERGQVLASLDTDMLEATVEHSKALLAVSQAQLAVAQATFDEMRDAYERATALSERGISTQGTFLAAQAAYQRAEASMRIAEADLRVSQADLSLNEASLAKACICSPIDGIVLDRNIEVGQIVASSFQAPVLFTLAGNLAQMELLIDIDEADIGQVETGQDATFTVEAYSDRKFPAKVEEIRYLPQTVDGVVTYEGVLSLDNSQGHLRPGMTAVADIIVERVAGVVSIPNSALRYRPAIEEEAETSGTGLVGMLFSRRPSSSPVSVNEPEVAGHRTVWILRDGAPVAVQIETGVTDGSVTEVRSGDLSVGDALVTDAATQK